MNRFISSILFFAVFVFCVNTGFGDIISPRREVVMGRFCMMFPRDSKGNVSQKVFGRNQKIRNQMSCNLNGTANISLAAITEQYSAWLEVKNGFGIDAFWIDTESRDYISFHQSFGNGEILLETGVLSEEQQKELGGDLEKAPEMARFHGSSPKVKKVKNAWELVFFLPPEEEEALQKVLQMKEAQALDFLRKKFLIELMLTRSSLEDEDARPQKTLNFLLEEGKKWIPELDSDSFQTRRLADAKLRGLGWGVIILAGETDWSKLSPEAERRLEFIVQETDLLGEIDDVLQQDVRSWCNSPQIWAAALKYGSDPQKKTAWEVLEKRFPDLFEKKLKSIGLDLDADSMEILEKVQKIYEAVQEDQ